MNVTASTADDEAASPKQNEWISQHVEELRYESHAIPWLLQGDGTETSWTFEINTASKPLENNHYAATITLRALVESEDRTIFKWQCKITGITKIPEASPEELEYILNVQSPSLLFPFLRQVLAECSRDAGLSPPILIDPIDFEDLYEQKLKAEATSSNHKV